MEHLEPCNDDRKKFDIDLEYGKVREKQVADIREEMERSVSDMRTQYSQAQEDWKKQAEAERRDLEASLHDRYQEQWATQKSEIDELLKLNSLNKKD